jgi:3-methyladenine DNA glycosylase Tag
MRWATFAKVATVVGVAYAYHYLHYFYTTPETVRAFYSHRDKLEQAIQYRSGNEANIDAAKLSNALGKAGFTSVRDEGTCTVFYYSTFMAAIDLWHEVVYSPKGHWYLPNYYANEHQRLYELRELDKGQWFYVIHN